MTRTILSSLLFVAMFMVVVSNASAAQLKSKQKGQGVGSFSELQGITTNVEPVEAPRSDASADGKYIIKKLPGRPRPK